MTLYVTAASFEERCLALPKTLRQASALDRSIVIDFSGYENVGPYLFNRARMLSDFVEKGFKPARIEADLSSPLDMLSRIESVILTVQPSDIVLDISAMPRNYLFCICKLLATIGVPTTIKYYRPLDYGSDLSRGIGSIRAIPGFEGDIRPGGETTLAVILGFEGYKALHAWESIGPTKVVALFGDPPYKPQFLEISAKNNEDFIEAAGTNNVLRLPLHTHDVFSAKFQLENLYQKIIADFPECSFILCPLGTKLQSLAAFAFAYENEAVAVANVSSLTYYTDEYSRGFVEPYTQVSLADLVRI